MAEREDKSEQEDGKAEDTAAPETGTAGGGTGAGATRMEQDGVTSGWSVDRPGRGDKRGQAAQISSNAISIFAHFSGDSTRRCFQPGSTGVTSTGATNGAAKTTGVAAEYVTAHTDEEEVVITTTELAGDGN